MGRSTLLKRQKELEAVTPFLKSLATPKASKLIRSKNVDGIEMLDIHHGILSNFTGSFVRPAKTWVSHSYNEMKQFHSFLRHLFCLYSVPTFFYGAFTDEQGIGAIARGWFIIVGRGESFHRASKAFFTAKEAHYFLKGPFKRWSDNAWWAKMKVRSWPMPLINIFLRRAPVFLFFTPPVVGNKLWESFIVFFTRYLDELTPDTFGELLDYLGNVPDNFSMSGRTLGSIIRLSNEWHTNLPKVKATDSYIKKSWEGLPIADWECEADGKTWTVTQLKTGRGLAFEAKIQHHCVMLYANRCIAGQCGIFTLHSIDEKAERKHVTIEVGNGYILQKKGKYNRIPTREENDIISAWAGANGLRNTKW